MFLKNTNYFFTPSVLNENILVYAESDVLQDIHLTAFGYSSRLNIGHSFYSYNNFNLFPCCTNSWNISSYNNDPKTFQKLIEVGFHLKEHHNGFWQNPNSIQRLQQHLFFSHSLFFLTLFSFYILVDLKNYMKYFYQVGNKSNNMKFISIFCHYILIAICINYLIESRSILVFEKRGTYRVLRT